MTPSEHPEHQDRLKAIAVDGGNDSIMPSVEAIADGTYAPLSRPPFISVNAANRNRPEVQEFMRCSQAPGDTMGSCA